MIKGTSSKFKNNCNYTYKRRL